LYFAQASWFPGIFPEGRRENTVGIFGQAACFMGLIIHYNDLMEAGCFDCGLGSVQYDV